MFQGIRASVWGFRGVPDPKNYVSCSCWEPLGIGLLFQRCDEMTWVILWHRKPAGLGSCVTCKTTHWAEKVHPICPDLPHRVLRAHPHAKKKWRMQTGKWPLLSQILKWRHGDFSKFYLQATDNIHTTKTLFVLFSSFHFSKLHARFYLACKWMMYNHPREVVDFPTLGTF